MKIVNPRYEIVTPLDGEYILKFLEECARNAYKSENRISSGSAEKLLRSVIRRGHESVIEHFSVTVRFIVDRGVSHELVRHRLASFTQESTRYCNYGKNDFGGEIAVVRPCFLDPRSSAYNVWAKACEAAEAAYFCMLDIGCTPQEARAVLPNSLKTEVIMTANLREWRHFFKLRCDPAAHPQMREVALPLLRDMASAIPVIFDDICAEVDKE